MATQHDFVSVLAADLNITEAAALAVARAYHKAAIHVLMQDGVHVALPGFGRMKRKVRAATRRRIPGRAELVDLPQKVQYILKMEGV